ncbi:hypothetical protein FPQ18DRAFT_264878 [Pyronema domesticum]|nr:hypothetical protein FPQ18DRAFT_264878 [Pyronema domesticum]
MFNIGIVGGGMAGLYAGMICKDLGLDFNILEASGRPGGRVWTHRFSDTPGDYYDVGAMRFPDTAIMKRTFDLFDKLGFEKDESQNPKQGNLIPYHFSGPNNPFYYNNILVEDGKVAGDEFKMSVGAGGIVPDYYLQQGVEQIMSDILEEWRENFEKDFDTTWKELKELDAKATSLRSYIIQKYAYDGNGKPKRAPHSPSDLYYVTNWLETMDAASTHYDQAFISILLHSLEFKWPASPQSSRNPEPVDGESGKNIWWSVNGGTGLLADRMTAYLHEDGKPSPVLFNHRVSGISRTEHTGDRQMRVTIRGGVEKKYSHVVTTATTACLRNMDLQRAELDYAQREALRVLRYDTSVKIGIKFSRRWWAEDKGITKGGCGKTDRPTRVVVYPSYALNTPKGSPGVLLACYNWSEDAARIGSLSEEEAVDCILEDLAVMHKMTKTELRDMMMSYHVHNWYHDELTNGAFGFFGPGMFSTLFGRLQRPAAGGKLVIAGEATSIFHGWIVASLNSSRRAIGQILSTQEMEFMQQQDKHLKDNDWPDRDLEEKIRYVRSLIFKLKTKYGKNEYEPAPDTRMEKAGNVKGIEGLVSAVPCADKSYMAPISAVKNKNDLVEVPSQEYSEAAKLESWQLFLGSMDPALKKYT